MLTRSKSNSRAEINDVTIFMIFGIFITFKEVSTFPLTVSTYEQEFCFLRFKN